MKVTDKVKGRKCGLNNCENWATHKIEIEDDEFNHIDACKIHKEEAKTIAKSIEDE